MRANSRGSSRGNGRPWALVIGLLALALGVAAHAALGQWRERYAARADSPARPQVVSATLRVRVAGVESPPLLVYLDAPDSAARPTVGPTAWPTVGTIVGQQAQTAAQLISVGSVYEPAFQVVPQGASVRLSNADPVAHNTHVFEGARTLFNVALPVQGVPVTRVLWRTGLFEVRCDLHAWMRAALFVPPNPHHLVIRETGEFQLRDIAPGRYRLHVWSRVRGASAQMIDLPPGVTLSLDLPAR